MIIKSVKSLIKEHSDLCGKIEGLEKALKTLHPETGHNRQTWEFDVQKDDRYEVKFLHAELMNRRAERTRLELSYAGILSNDEVERANTCLEGNELVFSIERGTV